MRRRKHRVSVLVPYRDAGEERGRNWQYILDRYQREFPTTWEIVVADSPTEVFSRSAAILVAASHATGDFFVVSDADVWCEALAEAVDAVADGAAWVDPASTVIRMGEEATRGLIGGSDFSGAGAKRESRVACGGMVVLSRQVFERCPPDKRFVGWGGEDCAWAIALEAAYGEVRRLGGTLWHLAHPIESRVATTENQALLDRYQRLRGDAGALAKLSGEGAVQVEAVEVPAVKVKVSRGRGQKPRVCVVSDVREWAFDVNAHELETSLTREFSFEHVYVKEIEEGRRPDWDRYDVIYELFHRNGPLGIPKARALGALRSEWFIGERPAPPSPADVALVNSYRGFQVATKRNYDELRAACPSVVYLTNPINTRRFAPPTTPLGGIVAEWNGNAGHSVNGRLIKHFWDIVAPACESARVPLVFAEYGTSSGPGQRRNPSEMPAFYHRANVALCASEYEAASYSVMEAMASGLALVATDVGNHRELRDAQLRAFGDTGIVLVERSVSGFVEALRSLTPERVAEMGVINRAEIESRWSWDVWHDRYVTFLEMAL